jgi:hypothetical protein
MEKNVSAMVFLALILLSASVFATKDYMMATVTASSPTGGTTTTTTTTGGTGGTGGSGGSGGSGTTQTETILETTTTGTVTGEELVSILVEAGYSAEQAEQAKELMGKAEITQTIKVEKTTGGAGGTTYKTTVSVTLNNTTGMDWKDVKVVVEVPKAIATNASEITSPVSFITLKADPILQFTTDIPANSTKLITWSVSKNLTGTVLDTIKKPIIASLQEVEPSKDLCRQNNVNCDDSNPCTTDSCTPATGECTHSIVSDETSCGANMVCKSGQCTLKPTGAVVAGGEFPWWIIIVIIIVAAAAYYYYTNNKSKKK